MTRSRTLNARPRQDVASFLEAAGLYHKKTASSEAENCFIYSKATLPLNPLTKKAPSFLRANKLDCYSFVQQTMPNSFCALFEFFVFLNFLYPIHDRCMI